MIVPTPIGNLDDISFRQFRALTTSDIVACEDTRKTGKLYHMMQSNRMHAKFKNEFGSSVDDFMEPGYAGFHDSEQTDVPSEMEELKKDHSENVEKEQPDYYLSEEDQND